jgi:hypothetical protein
MTFKIVHTLFQARGGKKWHKKARDFGPVTLAARIWNCLELFGATLKTFGVFA